MRKIFIAISSVALAALFIFIGASVSTVVHAATTACQIFNGCTGTTTQVANGVTYYDGTKITSGTGLTFNGTNLTIPYASTTALTVTGKSFFLGDMLVNGGTLFVDATNNRVGIGDTTPNASLEIGATATNATNIFDISGTYTSSASIASGIMDFSPTVNLGVDGSPVLMRSAPTIAPTVDITGAITGFTSNGILNSGSNIITSLNLNNSLLQLGAGYSGTVITLRGYQYSNPTNSGTGVVTNQIGVVMPELTGATNNTSLQIGNSNPQPGNWGIYTQVDYPNIFQASTTDSANAPLVIGSARAAIATGNSLGNLQWWSNDTNLTAPGFVIGSIGMVAEANHTAANQPSALTFSTTATGGTATNTEKVRITGAGNVGIGTTSPGTLLSLGNTGANTINISPTATSTFGSGINLRTGCFAVNDVCVTGSGGSGGSGSTVTVSATSSSQSGGGTATLTVSPISLVAGDTLTMSSTVIMNDDCTIGTTVLNIIRFKFSTHAATTSLDAAKNNGGTGGSCSASMTHTIIATTTVTVTPQTTSDGSSNPSDFITFTVQKVH